MSVSHRNKSLFSCLFSEDGRPDYNMNLSQLSVESWQTLATLIKDRWPYSRVAAVDDSVSLLANMLCSGTEHGAQPLLIAGVVENGEQIQRFKDELAQKSDVWQFPRGVVIFSKSLDLPSWVRPMFVQTF